MPHVQKAVRHLSRLSLLAASAALILVPAALSAGAGSSSRALEPSPDYETVELFSAIDAGTLDVKVVMPDSTEMQVVFKNQTDKPLNVRLPETVAAVPVLAQRGGGRRGGGAGGAQTGGGGFSGGGGRGGGGLYAVPAEKFAELTVPAVCLEYGKPEPRSAIKYELRRLEEFTEDAALQELMALFAQGGLPQPAVQAAAWHLADGLSWEELASIENQRLGRANDSKFTLAELKLASRLVAAAEAAAAQREKDEGSQRSERDFSSE